MLLHIILIYDNASTFQEIHVAASPYLERASNSSKSAIERLQCSSFYIYVYSVEMIRILAATSVLSLHAITQ